MNRIKANRDFLGLLCYSNKKLRDLLIKNANKEQIYTLCEIILNILNGNLKLSEDQLQKLSKIKAKLRNIIKRSSLKKKKYLIQKGGFLQILIPSIISGLATIISSFISK